MALILQKPQAAHLCVISHMTSPVLDRLPHHFERKPFPADMLAFVFHLPSTQQTEDSKLPTPNHGANFIHLSLSQ